MKKVITLLFLISIFPAAAFAQSSSDAEASALRMALEQALRENIALRADLEAARLEIDRIRGGVPRPMTFPSVVPAVVGRTHTVSAGETLGSIAARYLGSSSQYPRIHAANRDIISDPNVISVGQVLRIP